MAQSDRSTIGEVAAAPRHSRLRVITEEFDDVFEKTCVRGVARQSRTEQQ
jgi:hypothetical protein